MKKRKVAIVTGTRAEYGSLYWLMREIQEDVDLELQLIVTAMHLSPEFGLTYRLIEADGFRIDATVEMLLSSDTAVGTVKSMAVGLMSFADTLSRLSPDIIVVLGDRFEILTVAQAALALKIPVAHIHGGELSEGAMDDVIRHAITKMAHLHFVAADAYRQRVIQLGEHPHRVFNFGAPGLERIRRMQLYERTALEAAIDFSFGKLTFLVTYLPVTLVPEENVQALDALFSALDHFPEAHVIFTKSNADEAGRFVNAQVDAYVQRHPGRMKAFITLGALNYFSALQYVDVVIGNSSSGLVEVPFFKKPTINIGSRQAKRLRAPSVIDCLTEAQTVEDAIHRALSVDFRSILALTRSPYTEDKTASRIKHILKTADLPALRVKSFYDISHLLSEVSYDVN